MSVQQLINSLFRMKQMKTDLLSYIPEHFKVQELVDSNTYKLRGEKSLQLFDPRILWTIDRIREHYDVPMIVNNWANGGSRNWSGLRTKESPYYSAYSQHSFGRAIDFVTPDFDVKTIREDIKRFPNEVAFQYITAIEDFDGMGWVHLDTRNWDKKNKGLLVFSK